MFYKYTYDLHVFHFPFPFSHRTVGVAQESAAATKPESANRPLSYTGMIPGTDPQADNETLSYIFQIGFIVSYVRTLQSEDLLKSRLEDWRKLESIHSLALELCNGSEIELPVSKPLRRYRDIALGTLYSCCDCLHVKTPSGTKCFPSCRYQYRNFCRIAALIVERMVDFPTYEDADVAASYSDVEDLLCTRIKLGRFLMADLQQAESMDVVENNHRSLYEARHISMEEERFRFHKLEHAPRSNRNEAALNYIQGRLDLHANAAIDENA